MVKREELLYDSRDGQSKIYALKWIPDMEPVCVLQIIHGMAEHMECYDHFANFMAEHGILVVGEDHLGHGKSAADGLFGYFCDQDPATVLIRDVHRLKKMIQEENSTIPYFILGHSMGSFMLRNYLFRYGTGIQGAIIVGTGGQSWATLIFGKGLVKFLSMFQGWKHPSDVLNKISFGSYNKRIKNCGNSMEWLSKDTTRIDSYSADSKCGFTFTLNGFKTLFELISRMQKKSNLAKIPRNLPILFASGEEDPVGKYGKCVKEVYDTYVTMGMKHVTLKLYPGDRHEIMNEVDKVQVYEDFLLWMQGVVAECNDIE